MKYINQSFTLPVNTVSMSKMLYEYRLGMITAEEYKQITGCYPDEEKHARTTS